MAKTSGAQLGNSNGTKNRIWTEALRLALAVEDPKTKRRKLSLLADKLIAKALEGDVTALKEIGDRIEGKSVQPIDHGSDPDRPMKADVKVTIIDPAHSGTTET